jgi:hypothetical protein
LNFYYGAGVSGHICKRQEHDSSVRLCAHFL